MSSVSDQMLKDGNLEFSGGVDDGKSPSLIARNQCAFATNTSFRNGKAAPRPGLRKRVLTFPSESLAGSFKTLNFQESSFFDGTGVPMLLNSHGGRIWKTDLHTFKVEEITPQTGRNSSILKQAWSLQAENYWILQDNQSRPIIFDGAVCRRADPARKEVPVGNIMCYAMGRLAVALPDHQSFRIGDLVFGSSGTEALGFRDSILKFTENDYLNEGGDLVARVFGAASAYGPITCMKAVAMEDTQLGQGPMIIGTPNVVFTVHLPFDRTTWKNLANALQTVNPVIGPLGQHSTTLVNSDLWYRSLDGIRSYIMASRDFAQAWGNTPQSVEVNKTLKHDSEHLLSYGSSALFDNRLLMTVSPVYSSHGVWHRGLVSLDFNLISSLRGRTAPAWEGVWSGLRILRIISCLVDQKPRCFVWALNDAFEIGLWELDPARRVDHDEDPIQWSIDLGSYNCGDGFYLKKLETGEIFIDEVRERIAMKVRYRSDQNPCWQDWDEFNVCSLQEDCTVTGPLDCTNPVPMNLKPQFRSKLKLHTPADTFDTINARKFRTGYEFQPRLENSGYFEIKQLRIAALPEPESAHGERLVL